MYVHTCDLTTSAHEFLLWMLSLQVQSTQEVRLWLWGGIAGAGSRGSPAHVALADEANPGALGWQG